MFLHRNYPVYLWDGPRVGRANWACEPSSYVPSYRDQGNSVAWNFGPTWPQWWDDVQFPSHYEAAWKQATSARYGEYDTKADVERYSDVVVFVVDLGRIGRHIV